MKHPDQIGRMAVEGKPSGRMAAVQDCFFEGIRTAPATPKAVLRMQGRTALVRMDYGYFAMVSNGIEIRKWMKGGKGWKQPDSAEIEHFKADIARSAEHDAALLDYLRHTPVLRG